MYPRIHPALAAESIHIPSSTHPRHQNPSAQRANSPSSAASPFPVPLPVPRSLHSIVQSPRKLSDPPNSPTDPTSNHLPSHESPARFRLHGTMNSHHRP